MKFFASLISLCITLSPGESLNKIKSFLLPEDTAKLKNQSIISSKLPPLKRPHLLKTFRETFRRLCPSCNSDYKRTYTKHPKITLTYLIIYNQHLNGVFNHSMLDTYESIFELLGKDNISVVHILKRMSEKEVALFAKMFGSYLRSLIGPCNKDSYFCNPCSSLSVIKFLKNHEISLVGLLNLYYSIENYPLSAQSQCYDEFRKTIKKKFHSMSGIKVNKPLLDHMKLRWYTYQYIVTLNHSLSHIISRDDPIVPTTTQNALIDATPPKLTAQIITLMEDNNEECFVAWQSWSNWTHSLITCNKKKFIITGALEHLNTTPAKYSERKIESFRRMHAAELEFYEREILRAGKIKEKGCRWIAIEGAFHDWAIIGTEKSEEQCKLFEHCTGNSETRLFWSPAHQQYYSVAEAKKRLCDGGRTAEEHLKHYLETYSKQYEPKQSPALDFSIFEHPITPLEEGFISQLEDDEALGRYIMERIRDDDYPSMLQLFQAKLTTSQFLYHNDRHFFIYDSSPHMLLIIVRHLLFDCDDSTTDRIFNLWEQILLTSRNYNSKDESIFLDKIIRLAEISNSSVSNAPVNNVKHPAVTRELIEEVLIRSKADLKNYPIKAMIRQYVLV